MFRGIFFVFLSFSAVVFGLEKLDSKYCINYGDESAEEMVIEYFTFTCPQCAQLFLRDFSEIQRRYVDTGQVFWVFHPVPMDMPTVQAMACMARLSERQKRVFLESLLSELSGEVITYEVMTLMMKRAMEFFEEPCPSIESVDALQDSAVFLDAYGFMSQEGVVNAVPTVEVNGKMYGDFPSTELLSHLLGGGIVR